MQSKHIGFLLIFFLAMPSSGYSFLQKMASSTAGHVQYVLQPFFREMEKECQLPQRLTKLQLEFFRKAVQTLSTWGTERPNFQLRWSWRGEQGWSCQLAVQPPGNMNIQKVASELGLKSQKKWPSEPVYLVDWDSFTQSWSFYLKVKEGETEILERHFLETGRKPEKWHDEKKPSVQMKGLHPLAPMIVSMEIIDGKQDPQHMIVQVESPPYFIFDKKSRALIERISREFGFEPQHLRYQGPNDFTVSYP